MYHNMSRAELAEELGFVWSRTARDYVESGTTAPDFCSECDNEKENCECDLTAETVKFVTARKERGYPGTPGWILPGDRVEVTSGFTYQKNGKRTGYFRNYKLVMRGPSWGSFNKDGFKVGDRVKVSGTRWNFGVLEDSDGVVTAVKDHFIWVNYGTGPKFFIYGHKIEKI